MSARTQYLLLAAIAVATAVAIVVDLRWPWMPPNEYHEGGLHAERMAVDVLTAIASFLIAGALMHASVHSPVATASIRRLGGTLFLLQGLARSMELMCFAFNLCGTVLVLRTAWGVQAVLMAAHIWKHRRAFVVTDLAPLQQSVDARLESLERRVSKKKGGHGG